MAKERFTEINFRSETRIVISQANSIITELKAQGYTLTVRQLYYQFVSRGLLENKQQNYQRLASIIDDARKAGLIDWNAIEDRTRYLRRIPTYIGPASFLTKVAGNYAENLWADQDYYCEVWVEKDALLGVIEQPCLVRRVPYFACRGYASSSELYEAGKRLMRMADKGKQCIVFHLGDHDPSGLDMTRVNQDALNLFSGYADIEVRRLALNMEQVEEYNPPPNPAKESDSRFKQYLAEFGESSWELDALSPEVIDRTISEAIDSILDQDKFDAALEHENVNEDALRKVATHWDTVLNYLKGDEDDEGEDEDED